MTEDQDERLVRAFESIAETAAAYRAAFFPPKKEPTDATITKIMTEEERIAEEQRGGGTSIDEWLNDLGGDQTSEQLGPREAAFVANQKK